MLRLRQDDQARLTYKGASSKAEGVLSRAEIEFTVEDFDKAKQFLESLGYVHLIFYEKYRTTYELNDTHIMLDEMPYGDFIEIEGESIESIREIAGKLSLRWEAAVAASYHALFERVAEERGLDRTQLTFAVFAQGQPGAEELSVTTAD